MEKISFLYHPAIELICCISRYANHAVFQKELKNIGYKSPPEMTEWITSVKALISGYLEDEARDLFGRSYLNMLFIQHLIVNRGIESIAGLFSALKNGSPDEYLAFIFAELELDRDAGEAALSAAILDTHPKKNGENLLEQIRNPAETLERLFFMVQKFHFQFFEAVYLEVEEILQERIRYFQEKYKAAPKEFFQKILGMKLYDFTADYEVRVYVSHFNEASLVSQKLHGKPLHFAVLGYQIESILGENATGLKTAEMFKILSDEKRLQILRLTSQKRYYGNELAKELKITTATLSYHVSKLFELGVMTIRDGEANRIYYSADKEKLRVLLDRLYAEIIGGPFKQ